MDCLDLCISCGSIVADGTAYCSSRCMSLDSSAASLPRSNAHASSSSRRYYPQQAQLPESSYSPSVCSDEDPFAACTQLVQPCGKRASIESWARGVWGDSGDDVSSKRRKSTPIMVTASTAASSSASSTKTKSRASLPPRFTLTAQHLAPPTMGTTFTSTWSASSASSGSDILTPSSSHHGRRTVSPPAAAAVDPWIASPPYEFAYNHFVVKSSNTKQQQQQAATPDRGRPLIRL